MLNTISHVVARLSLDKGKNRSYGIKVIIRILFFTSQSASCQEKSNEQFTIRNLNRLELENQFNIWQTPQELGIKNIEIWDPVNWALMTAILIFILKLLLIVIQLSSQIHNSLYNQIWLHLIIIKSWYRLLLFMQIIVFYTVRYRK